MKKWMGFFIIIVLLFAWTGVILPFNTFAYSGITVGRIYYLEGELLRYIPEEKDWTRLVKDASFGEEDTLHSGNSGRAELIIPNGTWIRIGNNTQIQLLTMDSEMTKAYVDFGVSRFYNKSSDAVIKAVCPFGYVIANSNTAFDIHVGENLAEITAVKGKATFVHENTGERYDVIEGSTSIIADNRQVSSGEGVVEPDWDRWNASRDDFWHARADRRGLSNEYLPPDLRYDSYILEDNGRWEDVYYEGRTCRFWRPVTVVSGWSPFTVGRWTVWCGDQTWIPAEPFGYITHHYGNWIYASNHWYWAPPVIRVAVGLPLLDIGYYWYPGRVSWINTGLYLGWIPLSPREKYYSRRHWGGPNTVVVKDIDIKRININIRDHAYINHAVVVNQNDFYRVSNYSKHKLGKPNHESIMNDYHASPVVNNNVIHNYEHNRQRYSYSDIPVREKPHNFQPRRIEHNRQEVHNGPFDNNHKSEFKRIDPYRPTLHDESPQHLEQQKKPEHTRPEMPEHARPEQSDRIRSKQQGRIKSEQNQRLRPEPPEQSQETRLKPATPYWQRNHNNERQRRQQEQNVRTRSEQPDAPEQRQLQPDSVKPYQQVIRHEDRKRMEQPEMPEHARPEQIDSIRSEKHDRIKPEQHQRLRTEQPEKSQESGLKPAEMPSWQQSHDNNRQDVQQEPHVRTKSEQPDAPEQRQLQPNSVEPYHQAIRQEDRQRMEQQEKPGQTTPEQPEHSKHERTEQSDQSDKHGQRVRQRTPQTTDEEQNQDNSETQHETLPGNHNPGFMENYKHLRHR